MLKHFGRQMRRVLRVSSNVRKDESGSVGVEYSILTGLVGVALIGGVGLVTPQLSNALGYTSCALQNMSPTAVASGSTIAANIANCKWTPTGA